MTKFIFLVFITLSFQTLAQVRVGTDILSMKFNPKLGPLLTKTVNENLKRCGLTEQKPLKDFGEVSAFAVTLQTLQNSDSKNGKNLLCPIDKEAGEFLSPTLNCLMIESPGAALILAEILQTPALVHHFTQAGITDEHQILSMVETYNDIIEYYYIREGKEVPAK